MIEIKVAEWSVNVKCSYNIEMTASQNVMTRGETVERRKSKYIA